MTATNDLFTRLESLLEDWAADVTSTHQELADRVDSFRARLEESPERADDLEQVSAMLQAGKAHFLSLQESLRQCAEVSRAVFDRTEMLEKVVAALDEDVRGLKNMALHAGGEQGSFDGLEPPALTETINELRAALEDQRNHISLLEQQLATVTSNGNGPSQSKWSRLERDLARLRSELHRLRAGAAGDVGLAESTAFSEDYESADTTESAVLAVSGFDTAGRRRRMGEILVDAGVLNQEQLDRALSVQDEQPQRRLGSILTELGYSQPDEIAQVLASQARVPFVRLDREEPDPAAVKLVSERLASHHCCIPLRVEDDRIVLAMANPMDLIAIEDIEHATGRGVDANAASADGILQAIRTYYGADRG